MGLPIAKVFNRSVSASYFGKEGETRRVGTPTVTVLDVDSAGNVLLAKGATVPTDADAGYAKGCLFIDTDASAGAVLYLNEGSATSADFNVVESAVSSITGVTAGTGITGGGTEGAVTVALATTIPQATTWGVDDTGYDVKMFGATSGKSWLWDESADKMIVTGTTTLDGEVVLGTATGIKSGTANGIVPIKYAAVQNAVSTATEIGVTSYNTTIDSTSGALALTLAAGTFTGQARRVQMIVDNGEATLTFNSTATIVFADVGDVAELVWNGTAWVPVALYNLVDGATAPAYTPA